MARLDDRNDGTVRVIDDTDVQVAQFPVPTGGQSGQYAPAGLPYIQTTAVALSASRAYIVRFVAEKTRTIASIKFILTTAAGANDNCDVGIFSADLATLVASAGSTAGKLNGSLGVTSVSLPTPKQIIQGTTYYAAFASGTQGGTAAQVAMTNMVGSSALSVFAGSSAPNLEQSFQSSAFALAAPFTPGGATGNCPVLYLSES